MKVWIVKGGADYEGFTIVAVLDKPMTVAEAAEKYNPPIKYQRIDGYYTLYDYMEVDEYEVES